MAAEFREYCGIFGIWNDPQASMKARTGLEALQHRGLENAGIAAGDNEHSISWHKGSGLVSQVFEDYDMGQLKGRNAIGHTRYGTSGEGDHSQPVIVSIGADEKMAVAENGNTPSVLGIDRFLEDKKILHEGLNDTEKKAHALGHFIRRGASEIDACLEVAKLAPGASSLVILRRNKLIALRAELGVRPAEIGATERGYVIASETCAIEAVGAWPIRSILPGEAVTIDNNGLTSTQLYTPEYAEDIFELIYFARPDSLWNGRKIAEIRREFGRQLAREHPLFGDVVIPVPDSAFYAALGYAEELGIPFEEDALNKNPNVLRTFISANQAERERKADEKYIVRKDKVNGRVVIKVDDSIVRGTTAPVVNRKLRLAGAREIKDLSASAKILWPDYYGIDMPNQEQLFAFGRNIDQMREELLADYLGYLSIEGMVNATGRDRGLFHLAPFDGNYRIPIGERIREIEGVLAAA